jgi:hypothetical protein
MKKVSGGFAPWAPGERTEKVEEKEGTEEKKVMEKEG